jgi:predicted acylesterase/phospholipase RssA
MLTIEPALRRRASRRRIGIALAGGGPLGAFYEIGALHALAESIEGLDLTKLDVYVGVSSGSLIAAGLVNGIDTTAMGSIFIRDESTLFPFSPGILLRPATGELLRRLSRLPTLLARGARQYLREPGEDLWSAMIGPLSRAVPPAAFDNAPMGRFLVRLFSSGGRTNDFRRLRHPLYVIATNLNTGEPVRFGAPGFDHVPISHALLASTALPGLYVPVEIDGEDYVDGALTRTMNASLVHEEGADLVICVNPLVPFDASRLERARRRDLAAGGLPLVLSQTFRALIHSRMQVGMASYRERYPEADQLLLQPDRHDETLFFVNVFRYSDRARLVDHAYQRTRRSLREQAGALAPVLRRHGLSLRDDVLRDTRRTFDTAGLERMQAARQLASRLGASLDRLERVLRRRRAAA